MKGRQFLEKLKEVLRSFSIQSYLVVLCMSVWVLLLMVICYTSIGRSIVLFWGYSTFVSSSFLGILLLYEWLFEKIQKKYPNAVLDVSITEWLKKKVKRETDKAEKNEQKCIYLLDASVFLKLQEHHSNYLGTMQDILSGKATLGDNVLVSLAQRIREHACYISIETAYKMVRLEREGKVKEGTIDFIEKTMDLCYNLGPVEKNNKEYFELIGAALSLREKRQDVKLYIVSENKEIANLASQNQIDCIGLEYF